MRAFDNCDGRSDVAISGPSAHITGANHTTRWCDQSGIHLGQICTDFDNIALGRERCQRSCAGDEDTAVLSDVAIVKEREKGLMRMQYTSFTSLLKFMSERIHPETKLERKSLLRQFL